MGLGFSRIVAANREYPTIVDNMVAQGLIDSPAYSLYLVRPPTWSYLAVVRGAVY